MISSEQREGEISRFSFYVFLVTNTSNCVKMWYFFLIRAAFPTYNVILRQILFGLYFINKEQHEESTEECKKDLGNNSCKVSFQQ